MQIGSYEIVSELGRGGMGVVYRAHDLSLGRDVAIKLMLSASPSARATARFVREVEVLAQVSGHPGIVSIHRAGTLPDGRLFCVMEYVPGESLQALIERGPLSIERSVRYVARAAEAVHHAHGQGVVHRDLAPKNILIDDQDRPRILDFGLARPMADVARLTATGTLLGTPLFMAPEQVQGAHDAGPPADIYALGATLYACLAGRPPFPEGPLPEVIRSVLRDEPAPIAGLPDALCGILGRALAKDPRARYPSAQDLARDLDRFGRGERTSSRGSHRFLPPRVRRLPGGIVCAFAAAGLVLLVALGMLFLPGPEGVRAPVAGTAGAGGETTSPPGHTAGDLERVIARFRDPRAVGPEASLAFRAILPGRAAGGAPPDPGNPFRLWEEAERAALRRLLRGEPPADPPAAEIRGEVFQAMAEDPQGAFPVFVASHAALGLDGVVMAQAGRPPSTAGTLALARFRLVRNEPEEALRLLGELPAGGAPEPEVLLLRGIALFLLPDLERARTELGGVEDPALLPEATELLFAIARLLPGEGPEARLGEAMALGSSNLGNGAEQTAHRAEAGRVLDAFEARSGSLPPRLACLRARLRVDEDRFEEALRLLDEARAKHPDDPDLLRAYIETADVTLGAATPAGRASLRYGGRASDGAAEAAGALGLTPASLLLAARSPAAGRLPEAAEIAASDSWDADISPDARRRREALARGLDALGLGLAGRCLDRAIRLVATADAATFDARYLDATRLARLSDILDPGSAAPGLLAGLKSRFDLDAFGTGPPAGWHPGPQGMRNAPELLETGALRSGLDLPVRVGLGEMLLRAAMAEPDEWWRARHLRRARAVLEAADAEAGEEAASEARLLYARCLAELGERQAAADMAHRAVEDLRRTLLVARPVARFLPDAANVIEGAGRRDEAEELRWWGGESGAMSESDAQAAFAPLLTLDDPVALVDLSSALVRVAPTCATPLRAIGRALSDQRRPWESLMTRGRLLRLGRWEQLSNLPEDIVTTQWPAGTDVETALRTAPPMEQVDGLLGAAELWIVHPQGSPEDVVRGIGAATSLLSLGIAPGPLLALRAYGLLRLGDPRGALWDAEAALDARAPGRAPPSPATLFGEFARLPRLTAALALARMGDDGGAARFLDDLANPDWVRGMFRLVPYPILDEDLTRFAASNPLFRDLIPRDTRAALGE